MGYFGVLQSFFPPKHRNATKTHYFSKELKFVKNVLFWCISAFYATKLKMQGKHTICLRNRNI
ncbi:hypothetical protein E2C01_102718 [Portunus trituberculatus]|uniref:Uncharacterized protein n=1 Tax=Portunus trituberculatus TaxID=210409 RepID=A0A5B7KJ53_PORTR|nr:hypothetical protein [Portunus trituberculatus]